MGTAWWDRIHPAFAGDGDSPAHPSHPALAAIGIGGLIAGFCDLTYAIAFHSAQGVKPIRIPQSIASGLLGMSSYQGGWATAALGVLLHFTIAFIAAAIYYLASSKLPILVRRAAIFGPLYGAAIYFFMRWVVLPLSAAPHFRPTWTGMTTDFLVHLFLIGLPIALVVKRYRRPTTES